MVRQAACPTAAAFLNQERFQVTAHWTAGDESSGTGHAVPLTANSAYFYFFDPDNVEIVAKVLNACNDPAFNSYWVFAAGMTDVGVTLTVTDTGTGESRVYRNPLGQPFLPILDTEGLDTCP